VTFGNRPPGGSTTRISLPVETVAGLWRCQPKSVSRTGLARTLLETYVGSHAGELDFWPAPPGAEAGRRCRRAIMICDLA